MMPLIKGENISFSYSDGTEALKSISFEIMEGEKCAFIGSNGAGKSTLFLNLNGLLRPTSGKLTVDGIAVDDNKKNLKKIRQKVGMVFQNPDDQLFAPTVFEDVAFGPMNMGLPLEEVEERAKASLKKVGMEGFGKKAPHHLSGGQKKRVAIAGILAMKPKIMALDEPTSGLDPKGAWEILKLLHYLNKEGITIIITTHDVDLIPLFTDKVYVMHHGAIEVEGTPEEIFSNPELVERTHLRVPMIADLLYRLRRDGVDCDIKMTVKEAHHELLQILGKNTENI